MLLFIINITYFIKSIQGWTENLKFEAFYFTVKLYSLLLFLKGKFKNKYNRKKIFFKA